MKKIVVLGLGHRGLVYGNAFIKSKRAQIVAICDKDEKRLQAMAKKWGIPDENCFLRDDDLFNKGCIGDIIVIATQDRDHYGHAIKALNVGYNLLLEKPVSPFIEQCIEIEKIAKEKNLNVLVCHVLRYAPMFMKIKEVIDSGALGKIIEIRHSENVAYWHFVHSYVRGNWRRSDETSPFLLAKCCHDMDLLYWFCDSGFKNISAYGSLEYFKSENGPAGHTKNCFECPFANTCRFETRYQYFGRHSLPKMPWGASAFTLASSSRKQHYYELTHTEKGKAYARCVFECDNDVCDNMSLLIEMKNGIKCQFSSNAFNEKNYRHTEIRGTEGELIADEDKGTVRVRVFDKREKVYSLKAIMRKSGHGGGDDGIVNSLINLMEGKKENRKYSVISETIESHRMVAAAEISRNADGRTVKSDEIPDINR